jgi:saccharopine dehydrogenase-like NADP-dependent oxidoreductase
MKVVVLGGAGLTGQCAVRDLLESGKISEVVIADINLPKAREIADSIPRGNVSAAYVDLMNRKETANVLKGADVALNSAYYFFNVDAMEAALAAGTHYLDQGGLSFLESGHDVTKFKQMQLNDRFKEAGLTALVCMGNCTGISNVMSRYAVDKLDSVETIRIRDGWKDFTTGAPPWLVTWSIDTLLDEFAMSAIIFENGEYKEIPSLSRKEVVNFPEPVGTQEVYVTRHSEQLTLPFSFRNKGIKNVSWMEGGPGFLETKALADAGFGTNELVDVDGMKVSPRKFLLNLLASRNLLGYPKGITVDDYETARVEVIGHRNGNRAMYTIDWIGRAKKEWGANAGEYLVGVPSSIAAQMLAEKQIKRKGVVLPENCVDPKTFLTELTRRGIRITETVSAELA